MPEGTLKKFFADKGFGFIATGDGGGDVFAHKRAFSGDEGDIRDGATVTYEAEIEDRTGKPKASTWSIIGGGGGGGGGYGGYGGMSHGGKGGGGGGGGMGTLKKFFPDKGFGFITPHDGSGDLFAPARTFSGNDQDIRDGMQVSYQSGVDERSGKLRAESWRAEGGGGGGYGGGGYGGGYGAAPGHGYDPRASPYGPGPSYGGGAPAPYGGAPAPYGGAPAPYGGPPGQPPLPAGWEQLPDPTTGNPYYCNRATGESSWEHPGNRQPAPAPTPPPPPQPQAPRLPEGWEQSPDPNTGKTYYFNRATGQSSWDPPAF